MRFGRRTTRWIAALVMAQVATGCHQYAPVPAEGATPTGNVRVTLTDVGTVAVAPQLGPHVRMLDGRLIARTDSGFRVAVIQATRTDGVEQTFNGDEVSLARSSVQEIGTVRTAVGRSVALGAGILAAAIAIAASIKGGSGEGGPRTSGGAEPGK